MIAVRSADITERLVGISPIYLNKFLLDKTYGLTASIREGKVRKKRGHRLFSREDIFAIALVWILFESGLRTDPIRRVLKDIAGTKKADATIAAKKLLDSSADYLIVIRAPRGPGRQKKEEEDKPDQEVRTVTKSALAATFEQRGPASVLAIPVGQKFADVKKRLEILFPED